MQDSFTHQTTIYQYDLSSDWQRRKHYEKRDITSSVQQPITQVDRKDTALDSASLEILNKNEKPILPMTRFLIKDVIFNADNEVIKTTNSIYVVDKDRVSQVVFSSKASKRVYKHEVQLVEATKWLERFDVDNTTITNKLMFLYDDKGVAAETAAYYKERTGIPEFNTSFYSYEDGESYDLTNGRTPFKTPVSNPSRTIDCSCRMLPRCVFVAMLFGFPIAERVITGSLIANSFKVTRPDGTTVQLSDNQSSYVAPANMYGAYKFVQEYKVEYWGLTWTYRYTWTVWLAEYVALDKLPQRYSIAAVIDKVLSQVTRENTIRRASQAPLFQLDQTQRTILSEKVAPEFTFTQNTLFGILCEIGSAIHAMPRLISSDAESAAVEWDTITFEYFGQSETSGWANTLKISYNSEQSGENYTTAFVSNVQNAFVSKTTGDYITIEEPFDAGYISTRTEDASFEIGEDSAVIKTTRPIQRITELWAHVEGLADLDIASYCKEKADYDLLTDYMFSNPGSGFGLGTKQSAIYYTRGDNVIRGLDYFANTNITFTPTIGRRRTIQYILINAAIARGDDPTFAYDNYGEAKLVDISFRIKYVPYLNLKTKQFREVIRDEMETSTLYFNQGGQQVDINAYGEHIKGALNMTSNEEPTLTYVTKCPRYADINGLLTAMTEGFFGEYKPYEIRREISKKCCVTTIKFSKDFNKWNEYIAIKKNFRQYEISERECLEQNPIYNQFVIIDDQADYDKINVPDSQTQPEAYAAAQADFDAYMTSLSVKEGFMMAANRLMAEFNGLAQYNNVIKWMGIRTEGEEWDSSQNKYITIDNNFLLPTTSFEMGNSAIINVAMVDNYSAGTTTERPNSGLAANYRLEKAIQYGTKYGTFETLKVALGNGEFDQDIIGQAITQEERAQKLYKINIAYARAVSFIDIWGDPFVLNKDSRQKINLTMQLNCVSAKDYIWISSEFVKRFGLSAQALNQQKLRLRYFGTRPDRFLSGKMDFILPQDPDATVSFTQTSVTKFGTTYTTTKTYKTNLQQNYFKYTGYRVPVGWGLIDTNNNVILYYNKANEGNYPPDIYLQFRDRI